MVLEFNNVMVAVIGNTVELKFEVTTHADARALAESLVAQLVERGVPMEKQEYSKKDIN